MNEQEKRRDDSPEGGAGTAPRVVSGTAQQLQIAVRSGLISSYSKVLIFPEPVRDEGEGPAGFGHR